MIARLLLAFLGSAPVAACALVIGDLPDPVEQQHGADSSADSSTGGRPVQTGGAAGSTGGTPDGGDPGNAGTSGSGGASGTSQTGGAIGSGGAGDGGTSLGGSGGNGGSGEGGVAGTDVNTGGTCGNCDCDNDGEESTLCEGGKDCDDNDPEVKSTQTAFFPVARKSGGFDYNCSGAPERRPDQVKGKECTTLNCNASILGFLGGPPPCGEEGRWGTCIPGTLSCGEDYRADVVAECH